jgi:CRISPR-associated protein Cas1
VPLHHLNTVVCFGRIGLSVPLMHRLAQEGIALVLLDDHGRFMGRLEGPVSGNVLLRQAQHRQALDAAFTLDTARACVAGKIKNTRQVLMRGAREAKSEEDRAALSRAADDLAASLRALPGVADLDALRGVEGEAARQYFGGLSLLVNMDERLPQRVGSHGARSTGGVFARLAAWAGGVGAGFDGGVSGAGGSAGAHAHQPGPIAGGGFSGA